MGPKKKGVKKKVGKKAGGTKGPTIIDGVPVSEMTKDQLEGHVKRLQQELNKEREERNFHQLERDRLTTFWEVGKKQLEECRAEARVKDRELEEAEERHQTEVKIYKQKVKHLLFEQEHNLAELKAENMVSLKIAREEHQKIELLHLADKRKLQDDLNLKDKQYQNILRNMKQQQNEQIEKARQEFEDRVREIEGRYSQRFSSLRSELQLRLKSELSDTEERKNAHIDNMRSRNERSITEMKNYYNDITLNNLAMISTLKEEIKVKDEKLERGEQLLNNVQQENKKLSEPLKKAKEQLADLQRQIWSQDKERRDLNAARSKLKAKEKESEELKWELEVLRQKFERTVEERDAIHEKFSSSILDLQQKSSLKYLILEKKIKAMKDDLNIKDAQLHGLVGLKKGEELKSSEKESLLRSTRDVVREQEERIRRLERELIVSRQKHEWGDNKSDPADRNESNSSFASRTFGSSEESSSGDSSVPSGSTSSSK